jgi:hypothetical protein
MPLRSRYRRPVDRSLAADLLEGATAISGFTGIPEPRVFYLCERGYLPVFKIGDRWCALKSELRAALTSRRREATALNPAPVEAA